MKPTAVERLRFNPRNHIAATPPTRANGTTAMVSAANLKELNVE